MSQPGDRLEREADKTADAVVDRPGSFLGHSLSSSTPAIQRQDSPPAKKKTEEEKYKEAAKKTGEALLETETGKKIKEKAEAVATSLPGMAILGAAAAGIVTKAAIKNEELPIQPPDIPLDKVGLPGMKMKLTWEGPVRSPKKAMITFSGKFGGGKKKEKPKQTRAEKQRAENAKMAEELRQFRESMKTPEQKEADDRAMAAYIASKMMDPTNPLYIPGLQPLPRALPLNPREAEKKKDDDEGAVQRAAKGSESHRSAGAAPPVVYDALRSPGRALEPNVRSFMEKRFGQDFSGVRVHTDSEAVRASRAIDARAYTVGNDIVFGSGEYAPQTEGGRKLLAHELTHVVQQSGGGGRATGPNTAANHQIPGNHNPLEREAQNAARRIAAGGRPTIRHQGVGILPMRHPVYISRHGRQPFLDRANEFYTRWGYSPIRTGVDSIEEIVGDLSKRSSVGHVTIVTHAHPTNLFMAFLTGGPGRVTRDDWNADMIDDSAEGEDARHRQDTSELTRLETHALEEDAIDSVISALNQNDRDRALLDRIGPSSDSLVRQFVWWATDRAWIARAGYGGRQTRRLRATIQGHMNQYRDTILAAYAAGAVGSSGTAPPVESDFDALRDAIERLVQTMGPVEIDDQTRSDIARQVAESPSEEINRVIRDPVFAQDLERVRGMISDSSWFEIQGCRAGQDRGYIQAMQQFFRNGETLPRVTAPNWFQFFGWLGYNVTRTGDRDIQRRWADQRVREALEHWYPIITGNALPDPLTEEHLRDYLTAPHVLPLTHPNQEGNASDFLVDAGMREEAFLNWFSLHSYRITEEQKIRESLFTERGVNANVRRTIVDWLQRDRDRDAPTQMVFRPDPEYQQHIIEA